MKIKAQHRRKKAGRRNGIEGRRCPIARFFIGFIVWSLLFGLAGIASAAEGLAGAQGDGAAGQKQAEERKGTGQTDRQAPETVVARVNGAAITKRSLDQMIGQIQLEPATEEKPRERALNRLIFQELVYQKAKQEGFKISNEDLEATISEIKTKEGGQEAYSAYLKKISRSEDDMRAAVERSLILQGYYKKEITDKIIIPEEKLKAEYERNRDKFVVPEAISAIDVVFFLNTNDKASFKKAEEIRNKIAASPGKNPLDLEPDGTFIVREVSIKKDLDEDLYREAKKLKEGELSEVFKTQDSLHILKLMKYSPKFQVPFEQVRAFITQKLRNEEKNEMVRRWELELRKGAVIEIMPQGNEK